MKFFDIRTLNPYQSRVLASWGQKLKNLRRSLFFSPAVSGSPLPGYHLIQERDQADQLFLRIREVMYEEYSHRSEEGSIAGGRGFFWESGKITPGRPYFYIKKCNEKGWLFERSGVGWLVSRSEKIVHQSLFLRLEEPVDIVTAYGTNQGSERYKVNSELMGGELISFVVYERLMLRQIFAD